MAETEKMTEYVEQ